MAPYLIITSPWLWIVAGSPIVYIYKVIFTNNLNKTPGHYIYFIWKQYSSEIIQKYLKYRKVLSMIIYTQYTKFTLYNINWNKICSNTGSCNLNQLVFVVLDSFNNASRDEHNNTKLVFESFRLMKSVRFRTVPSWLHQSVYLLPPN